MKAFSVLFFFCLSLTCTANDQIDSLQALLEKPIPDSLKLEVLESLLTDLKTSDPTQAIFYGLEGLELSRNQGKESNEVRILNNLGIAFYGLGNYNKTLEYFLLVLEKEKLLSGPQSEARALNNLGIIYDEIGKLDKSISYYEQSLAIKETLNDSMGISNTMSNLGLVYFKAKQAEKALTYFRKSYRLDSILDYNLGLYNSLHNIGLYHKDYGSIDSALLYLEKSLNLAPKETLNYDKAYIFRSLAQAYYIKGNYQQSEYFFTKAIELAETLKAPEISKEAYKGLSEIYEDRGNYKKSLDAYKQYKSLNDSIFNEDFNREVTSLEKSFEINQREQHILLLENEASITDLQLSRRQNTNYFLIAMGIFLAITVIISVNRYHIKEKANLELQLKNEEITIQKSEIKENRDEIAAQRDSILHQKQALEEASNEILKSIWYAQGIQKALLPDIKQISTHFASFSIVYLPKSIVSGDFYWFTKTKNKVFFALVDCTGHGIPGAFMTVMANDLLNSIIVQRGLEDCSEILNLLDKEVMASLRFKQNSSNDGLDIALISWDVNQQKLVFAGANRNMILFQNKEWKEIKGQRYSIGGLKEPIHKKPENIELQLSSGDQIYLYTDGYIDQFGGENDTKFMKKRLMTTLKTFQDLPAENQKNEIERVITEWKGDSEQTDDITLAYLKV